MKPPGPIENDFTGSLMKVIIVDDAVLIRKRISERLGEFQEVCVVGETDDVAEALQMVQSQNPNLVILGISMPKGNGFSLLNEIRTNNMNVRVFMFSSCDDPSYRRTAGYLGADGFFDKSTEYEVMITFVVDEAKRIQLSRRGWSSKSAAA